MEQRNLWADVDGYLGSIVIQKEDLAGLTVRAHDRWEDDDDWDEDEEWDDEEDDLKEDEDWDEEDEEDWEDDDEDWDA